METVLEHLIKAAELLQQQERSNKERLDNLESKLDMILDKLNNIQNTESNINTDESNDKVNLLEENLKLANMEIERKEQVINQLELRNQELDRELESIVNNDIDRIKDITVNELKEINPGVNKLFNTVNQCMHILKGQGYTFDKESGLFYPPNTQQEVYNQPTEKLKQEFPKVEEEDIDVRISKEILHLERHVREDLVKYDYFINNQSVTINEIIKLLNRPTIHVVKMIKQYMVNGVFELTGKNSGKTIKAVSKELLLNKRIEEEINKLSNEDKEWINNHNYYIDDKQIFFNDVVSILKTSTTDKVIKKIKEKMVNGVFEHTGLSGKVIRVIKINKPEFITNPNVNINDNSLEAAEQAFNDSPNNNLMNELDGYENDELVTADLSNNNHDIINKDGIVVARMDNGQFTSATTSEEEAFMKDPFAVDAINPF